MYWKNPPPIKIYEALGALADRRVKISDNTARVYSSSGNKFYTVSYEPKSDAIMVNDNGSYYQGYLGYPAIAFLMIIGRLQYDPKAAEVLKGVAWKDLNVRFKNDYEKTIQEIFAGRPDDAAEVKKEVDKISGQLNEIRFKVLGQKVKPPSGY